jgi:hypothetical protein
MIGLRDELKNRFHCGALWYLEGWELHPNDEPTEQDIQTVELFEQLCETVDAIPADVLRSAERFIADGGWTKFDDLLGANIDAVGRKTFPQNATEFLKTMNLSLMFAN